MSSEHVVPEKIIKMKSEKLHAYLVIWVCHNSVNVSGNVIMLVEMAMLVVQCSQ
jgi:hypothetical protein